MHINSNSFCKKQSKETPPLCYKCRKLEKLTKTTEKLLTVNFSNSIMSMQLEKLTGNNNPDPGKKYLRQWLYVSRKLIIARFVNFCNCFLTTAVRKRAAGTAATLSHPYLGRRFESAEPASCLVTLPARFSFSTFAALEATSRDVLTEFFAIVSPPFV